MRLTTNYRSHPEIIDFYNRWMREQEWEHDGQEFRYQKRIEPRDEAFPAVPMVVRVAGQTQYDQQCVAPFLGELRRPENEGLLRWARAMAKQHLTLTTNAD